MVRSTACSCVIPGQIRARAVRCASASTVLPPALAIRRWNSRSFATSSSTVGSGPRPSSSSAISASCSSLTHWAAGPEAVDSSTVRTWKSSTTDSSWCSSRMKVSASRSRDGSSLLT